MLDFGFFEFHELFRDKQEQIRRVEQLSDAYHLALGEQEVMVAYLLEVRRSLLDRVGNSLSPGRRREPAGGLPYSGMVSLPDRSP